MTMKDEWRGHAKRGDWNKIVWQSLPDADQVELLEMLRGIVPTRVRGHGVETFEGFIAANETRSYAELCALMLAEGLERWQESKVARETYDCPLYEANEYAIEILQDHGIKYEGNRETFLYWSASRGRWRQIPGSMAAALKAKQWKIRERIEDLPETERDTAIRQYVVWEAVYPWRMCKSLHMLWRIDAFEPNTPIWHALAIFDWLEQFQDAAEDIRSGDGDYSIEDNIIDATESAFEIGRSYEALIKKPFEPHALRGMKTVSSASDGGRIRAGETQKKTRAVLRKMERLILSGKSQSNAAKIAFKQGYGSSAEANRKLWQRRRRK